jgi:pyruvate dehydrogenase E2 component (dihydrolipoamide acetyltransferase)
VQLVTGGTFTITNLGTFGIDAFTPIVNPPEVAILGVGRITERPVRDQDSIAWTRRMTLSLTFDHRAVDGVPAATFLRAVTGQLEDPGALFA